MGFFRGIRSHFVTLVFWVWVWVWIWVCYQIVQLIGKRLRMKSDSVFLQETLHLLSKKVGLLKSITLLCLMRSFVYIISAASSVSILCRHETEDGRPVPLLFRIRLILFHVFIVSTLFASSLMIKHKHKPRVERFFWIIAMASTFQH